MNKKEYREYLFGRHWRRFRMKIIRERDGVCEICGVGNVECIEDETDKFISTAGGWNVHHWHYKTIGKERRCDVSLLCEECHKDVHRVIEGKNPDLWRKRIVRKGVCGSLITERLEERKFYEQVAYLARQSIC